MAKKKKVKPTGGANKAKLLYKSNKANFTGQHPKKTKKKGKKNASA